MSHWNNTRSWASLAWLWNREDKDDQKPPISRTTKELSQLSNDYYDHAIVEQQGNITLVELVSIVEARKIHYYPEIDYDQLSSRVLVQTSLLELIYPLLAERVNAKQVSAIYCLDDEETIVPELYENNVYEAPVNDQHWSRALLRSWVRRLDDYSPHRLDENYYFRLGFHYHASHDLFLSPSSSTTKSMITSPRRSTQAPENKAVDKTAEIIDHGREIYQLMRWRQEQQLFDWIRRLQLWPGQPCLMVVCQEELLPGIDILSAESLLRQPVVQLSYRADGSTRLVFYYHQDRISDDLLLEFYNAPGQSYDSREQFGGCHRAEIVLPTAIQLPPLESELFDLSRAVRNLSAKNQHDH